MYEIYMGYAQEDITPQKAVQIVGYDARPDNTSKGILHCLTAQTLVWKTPAETCCLIAIDSLGFTVELTTTLRTKAADILKTTADKIMVCFSHTHAAPNAAIEPEYYQFVCEKIITSAEYAKNHMFPVHAAWGAAENTIGVNRRESGRLVDPHLGILKLCDAQQNHLKLLILRVTAHGNVLMPDNHLISSDYFGVTRDILEYKFGCKIMLIQGASGNVRPKFRQENADYLEIHPAEAAKLKLSKNMQKKYINQSLEALENMAYAIYHSVEKVIDNITVHPVKTLTMFSVNRPFYATVPTMDQAATIAANAFKNAAIDGTGWLCEVERLLHNHIKQQTTDVEIQYFALDNGCFCGIPNEAMTEIAVEVRKKANMPFLFFNGYTNGCSSYLPTAEEYDKGGYEVLWNNLLYYQYHGRVMPFDRDTAKLLEHDVVKYWRMFLGRNSTCLADTL